MIRFAPLLAAAALASAAIAFSVPASAQSFSDAQRDEMHKIIREYLVKHPEVLQEAMAELEKKQALAEAEKARSAIKNHSEAIFNSPRHVTLGNPQGDVTFVEFFDYNCGYCKRALDDMMALMAKDPKLKVVLKEFPVLGPNSTEAAKIGVAVRMQDKTGKKYLEFHQKLLAGRGQIDKARAMAVAKEIGLDMGRLEKDLKSDEIDATLAESMKLAEALGLNGTPSYVINNDVVVGAVGLAVLGQKIQAARVQ
jgi:protein-disulfide isomerase